MVESNLVKMRNSNLGQSAPSLTASLVGQNFHFNSLFGFSKYTIDGAPESPLLSTSAPYTFISELNKLHLEVFFSVSRFSATVVDWRKLLSVRPKNHVI